MTYFFADNDDDDNDNKAMILRLAFLSFLKNSERPSSLLDRVNKNHSDSHEKGRKKNMNGCSQLKKSFKRGPKNNFLPYHPTTLFSMKKSSAGSHSQLNTSNYVHAILWRHMVFTRFD